MNTRQKLTEVAFELFGRNGFHAIGLDAIIAAAGVSKQTFYNHFECKDDLVLAVLALRHEAEGALIARLFDELAGPSPKARLYKFFDVLQAWFDQPAWRGCIFVTAAAEFPLQNDPAHQAAAAHFRHVRDSIQAMAEQAGARDPKRLADQMIVLVDGLVSVRHVTGSDHYMPVTRAIAKDLLDQQFENVRVDEGARMDTGLHFTQTPASERSEDPDRTSKNPDRAEVIIKRHSPRANKQPSTRREARLVAMSMGWSSRE